MPGGYEVMIPGSGILGKVGPLAGAAEGGRNVETDIDCAETLCSARIWMHFLRRFRRW